MNFEITEDNRPYVEARGRIVLNACPGSGKTSAIAYKLKQLTEECKSLHGDYAGVACLSFTNVAKDEIAHKFESISGQILSYPHTTSTLDSFINQYITLPFYHLFKGQIKRPTIENTLGFLDKMNFGRHFALDRRNINYIYSASKIKFEIDGSYTWNGHQPDAAKVDVGVFNAYAKAIKKWQFTNGFLTNDDSTFLAMKLLIKCPEIAKNLATRFPYVIVDEAQDTSEIQYKILDLLNSGGLSNIELVGDPYQSLYEFREAKPKLFVDRFNDTTNWQPLRFNSCRRSSQGIVDAYSIFRNAGEGTVVSVGNHATDHNLKVIRYDPEDLSELITKFTSIVEPGDKNYILVRGTTHLEKFGVKTSHENPWKIDLAKSLAEAQVQFRLGNSKACIDMARSFLAEISVDMGNYRAKVEATKTLKEDTNLNITLFDFVLNMPTIDDTISEWTRKLTEYIKLKFGVDVDLQLKQRKGADYYAQNVKELLYPSVSTPYPVSTIHKVKGMTFDAVLLVLSKNSSGSSLSLNDFKKPTDLPNERQRMIYVALSRPSKLACIAVPEEITEQQVRTHLGIDIEFI